MPLRSSSAQLPVVDGDIVAQCQADFENASKQGVGTRDALIRLIWALVHSNLKKHIQRGIKLAKNVATLSPAEEQEVPYLIAVGEYKLGNLSEARQILSGVLDKHPAARQAQNLKASIEEDMTNDALAVGAVGALAVVGGIAAVVAGSLLSGKSR